MIQTFIDTTIIVHIAEVSQFQIKSSTVPAFHKSLLTSSILGIRLKIYLIYECIAFVGKFHARISKNLKAFLATLLFIPPCLRVSSTYFLSGYIFGVCCGVGMALLLKLARFGGGCIIFNSVRKFCTARSSLLFFT